MTLASSCLRCIIRLPKYRTEHITALNQSYQVLSVYNEAYNLSKRSFKSEIHTDNLYPGSKVSDKFAVPQYPSTPDIPAFNGVIPIKELELTYTKSSAPGGQNVNKVATKVEARFKLEKATWLNNDTKTILEEKWKNQLTKDGYFVVTSERTRSQQLNQVG